MSSTLHGAMVMTSITTCVFRETQIIPALCLHWRMTGSIQMSKNRQSYSLHLVAVKWTQDKTNVIHTWLPLLWTLKPLRSKKPSSPVLHCQAMKHWIKWPGQVGNTWSVSAHPWVLLLVLFILGEVYFSVLGPCCCATQGGHAEGRGPKVSWQQVCGLIEFCRYREEGGHYKT